ncbi:MAG TPA: hypothetical protein VH374_13590 [Polyangia bacterium]|nr:hypothetical protein [Polyangia bacterium]
MNNYNLISIVMAIVILGGGYMYYARNRRDVERNLMEAQSSAPEKERSPASKPRVPLPFVLLLVGVCLGLFFGYPQFEAMWQARHPAVKEHLAELIQVAAKQLDCPADAVKVTAENPMQARVDACGKTMTFRWGRVRTNRLPHHWHPVDPNCRFEYLGSSTPCS